MHSHDVHNPLELCTVNSARSLFMMLLTGSFFHQIPPFKIHFCGFSLSLDAFTVTYAYTVAIKVYFSSDYFNSFQPNSEIKLK